MKKILVLFALLMTGVMGIHAQEGLKWGLSRHGCTAVLKRYTNKWE